LVTELWPDAPRPEDLTKLSDAELLERLEKLKDDRTA
jgi:hypothetical protein